ncbi:MAG: leucyl aminopeptidase [Elusimicrobia bacterium]|nr:leucyl aminopeptidase [Elusimicrobiota bacterium]
MLTISDKATFKKGAALLVLTEEQVRDRRVPFLPKAISAEVGRIVKAGLFEGKRGEAVPTVLEGLTVLLLGTGKAPDITPTSLRIDLRRGFLAPALKRQRTLEVVFPQDTELQAVAAVDAFVLGTYAWKKYVTPRKDDASLKDKSVILVTRHREAAQKAVLIARAANLARDLINDNADVVTPVHIERQVRALVKGKAGISLEVLDRKKLAARKMGLILAVNQGSNKEPRVVIVRYNGGKKGEPATAFVGKGLTFDSGGLNLKPSGHMETMREDMSGAAAVVGLLKAAIDLKVRKNLIFAMGLAENAIDANAYKPGDVIRGHTGITVEVGNTDAEGRLVLADVLSYVSAVYKPGRIIDLATLTGACVVALGHDYAGLLSNDDALAQKVLKSAEATDDRCWRLPLYPEYKDAIKSKIADIKNTSNVRGAAGTISGAEFLRRFVGKTPWVHLDIAGTAFVENDSRWYYGHGATGFGVRLLSHYLLNN